MRLSHPERVLYPEQGLTKFDLANYYAAIGDWMLPGVVERPLTLVRCPRGRAQHCFYQKHIAEGLPEGPQTIEITEKSGTGKYVWISDLSGLITLVQMGVLEIHPWGSRNDNLERPDRLIFDLDPGPEVAWKDIVEAAKNLRARLRDLGLESFVRTTGGKGLHLVAPLVRRTSWDQLKSFAKVVALGMEHSNREKFIAVSTKAKRTGRIFVDYLRNDRGATAIASYSTRARAGATVATPLRWKELTARLKPEHFTVKTILKRLSALKQDPWHGFADVQQTVAASMVRKAQK